METSHFACPAMCVAWPLRHGGYGHSPTYKDAAVAALSDVPLAAVKM